MDYGRKVYINFLYLRGFRADDGFSWKLAAAIYLLLEGAAVARLKPRVFKKSSDMLVDMQSKMLLITVLLLGIYSDQQSNVLGEGKARPSDDYFCGNFNLTATAGPTACDATCLARHSARSERVSRHKVGRSERRCVRGVVCEVWCARLRPWVGTRRS